MLYYDKKGEVKAVGAEADSAHAQANAEDEGWVKVELYVHLSISTSKRPDSFLLASSYASDPAP